MRIFLIILVLSPSIMFSQFGSHNILGVSSSVFPNSSDFNPELKHYEVSVVGNYMTSITSYYYLGLEYIHTSSIGSLVEKNAKTEYFHTLSIINHVNLINKPKFRGFIQFQADYSNYFLGSETDDPVHRPGSIYSGWGSGMNLRIFPKISLDFAFKYSYLINRKNIKGYPIAFGYWTLGVNYDLLRD